ncbi:hypothetical protein ACFY05_32325 [Microtetraspora fusca]|uniref:Uncharacterized protein n=1 Tax=Microtetraspora fusca TaxID=1997 RepID=A0ABW6VDY2_MICFU
MRLERVTADADGIVVVQHDLGTTSVGVRCEDPAGQPVGYMCAVALDPDRVEVLLAPGTAVSAIVVESELEGKEDATPRSL